MVNLSHCVWIELFNNVTLIGSMSLLLVDDQYLPILSFSTQQDHLVLLALSLHLFAHHGLAEKLWTGGATSFNNINI